MTMDFDAKIRQVLTKAIDHAEEYHPYNWLARCESPIEELLCYALWANGVWMGRAELVHASSLPELIAISNLVSETIYVAPQVEVGRHRVDFLLAVSRAGYEPPFIVAIECDGHEFHEKTKKQAARDKARDRAIMAHGVQVHRFTGSEIWNAAGECALSILNLMYSAWFDSTKRNMERIGAEYGNVDAYLAAMRARRSAQ